VPQKYRPSSNRGKRVPGWEDTNITTLALDMGVSYRYLLGVLTGQRNTTLAMLQSAANCLGIGLPALVARMEQACRLKLLEAANSPGKAERRRIRNERRAIRAQ
jgi:transcriptional regulator with XRE-family HTH domain